MLCVSGVFVCLCLCVCMYVCVCTYVCVRVYVCLRCTDMGILGFTDTDYIVVKIYR